MLLRHGCCLKIVPGIVVVLLHIAQNILGFLHEEGGAVVNILFVLRVRLAGRDIACQLPVGNI